MQLWASQFFYCCDSLVHTLSLCNMGYSNLFSAVQLLAFAIRICILCVLEEINFAIIEIGCVSIRIMGHGYWQYSLLVLSQRKQLKFRLLLKTVRMHTG